MNLTGPKSRNRRRFQSRIAVAALSASLFFALDALGQAGPSSANSRGHCSPAITGNNNTFYFRYCGNDPEQEKKIIALLNKLLANQDSPSSNLMLDELLTIASRPRVAICDNNTLSNCVAGDNYGPQTVNGYVPPPPRAISQDHWDAAVALLKTAPRGSRFFMSFIGSLDDREISSTFLQIIHLFEAGNWILSGKSYTSTVEQNFNGVVSHGEGIGCSITSDPTGAGRIATKALVMAGLPCTGWALGVPQPRGIAHTPTGVPPPTEPNIYISVGTRIIMPK